MFRLSAAEQEDYLKVIFSDKDTDSSGESDSEDEDWVPEPIATAPVSDNDSENDESQNCEDTEDNADEQAEEQGAIESHNRVKKTTKQKLQSQKVVTSLESTD